MLPLVAHNVAQWADRHRHAPFSEGESFIAAYIKVLQTIILC